MHSCMCNCVCIKYMMKAKGATELLDSGSPKIPERPKSRQFLSDKKEKPGGQ